VTANRVQIPSGVGDLDPGGVGVLAPQRAEALRGESVVHPGQGVPVRHADDHRMLAAQIGVPGGGVPPAQRDHVAGVEVGERAPGDGVPVAELAGIGEAEQVPVEGGTAGQVGDRQRRDDDAGDFGGVGHAVQRRRRPGSADP
jgi:hypothetical protein